MAKPTTCCGCLSLCLEKWTMINASPFFCLFSRYLFNFCVTALILIGGAICRWAGTERSANEKSEKVHGSCEQTHVFGFDQVVLSLNPAMSPHPIDCHLTNSCPFPCSGMWVPCHPFLPSPALMSSTILKAATTLTNSATSSQEGKQGGEQQRGFGEENNWDQGGVQNPLRLCEAYMLSCQNNKFNYYIVVNLLLTWVSPALSKNGVGYIPVIR